MSDLGKNLDEQTSHARADRRYAQGVVIAVDPVQHTCTVDVGAADVTGAAVHLEEVPFQPQTPPSIGDNVGLVYANASPHSVSVAGGALSGQNGQGSLQVVGAVTSLAASGGGATLQGAVTIAGAGTVSVSESGQTITVTGAAGVSALNSLTGALSLAAGANVTLSTAGNTITISASGGSSGGVSSVNSLTGAVTLAAGANVMLSTDGNTVTIDASAGVTPMWSVTTLSPSLTTYAALDTDSVIFCYTETNALTLTLPDPTARRGKVYVIFNAYQGASQGLTVTTAAGSVIGITNLNGGITRKVAWYISDGANWHSFENSGGN